MRRELCGRYRVKLAFNLLACLVLVISSRLRESPVATVLWWLAIGYITLDLVHSARSGYLRRKPHWTPESWRRYLTVCLIPLGALAMLAASLVAHDLDLPIIGASGSVARGIFAAVSTLFLLIGAVGLATALSWLSHGDPTRQFDGSRWLRRAKRAG